MAGRIVVVRAPRRSGWAARFAVRIDGKQVGKVAHGTMRDFDVEPGAHRVRVSQFGYTSKTLVVGVAEGETAILRTGLRFWINFLNSMSGGLIGGSGYWLFAHGPTPIRVILFAVGLAGLIGIFVSRLVIHLSLDSFGERRGGHTAISTDTMRRR